MFEAFGILSGARKFREFPFRLKEISGPCSPYRIGTDQPRLEGKGGQRRQGAARLLATRKNAAMLNSLPCDSLRVVPALSESS